MNTFILLESPSLVLNILKEEKNEFNVCAGANVNAEDNHSLTPLHFASQKGHVETVCVLLNAGECQRVVL